MRGKYKYTRKDILRRLGELAFGRANDVVRLAFMDADSVDMTLDGLDLTLLSELKRSGTGVMEIKLVNRLEALTRLAELTETGTDENADARSFLKAMDDAARLFSGDVRE